MLTVDNSCCRDRWPPSVLVSGCSKLYAGKGIMLGHLFDAHQTPISTPPPFFSLRSLYETCRYRVNAAIQRIQRLMGSTAFLTDGAGGSAQTN